MKFNLYYHKSTFENIMIPLLKTLMETVALIQSHREPGAVRAGTIRLTAKITPELQAEVFIQ